jgi:glutamyl-Q tRNA(Asp) synthetase
MHHSFGALQFSNRVQGRFARRGGALAYGLMFVTRFAPSPTGYLHLGHAYSALMAYAGATETQGRFILRIEDTDITRCKPEYEAAIFEDLAWLGLMWETPVRRQSEHMTDYAVALDTLIKLGLMYRCFRTRQERLADIAHAPHGHIASFRGAALHPDEEAQKLLLGAAFAWRLSLDRCRELLGRAWSTLGCEMDGVWTQIDPSLVGDAVIARKEFPASYHLACVHDDAFQGVTQVIRGEDLREAAHLHVLLQALLGLPTPTYRHHKLILDEKGKRLAKRDKAATLRSLRDAGVTPDSVRAHLGLPR